jgi:hypothetical protein
MCFGFTPSLPLETKAYLEPERAVGHILRTLIIVQYIIEK